MPAILPRSKTGAAAAEDHPLFQTKRCYHRSLEIASIFSDLVSLFRVGMSNILDGELVRRGPVKRSHREVVGAAVMDSELLGEVIEGVETVTGVKALLILPVASLDLAVVARCVGTDELVADL